MDAIRLDHAVIAVSDWERSNVFYQDVVGAELVDLDGGRYGYRFGDQQLNVHGPGTEAHPVAREPVRPGNSDLCFVWAGRLQMPSRTSSVMVFASRKGPSRAGARAGPG